MQGGSNRSGHGRLTELLADQQQSRYSHPVVVRRQLVAAQDEPRLVPAHTDPGADADGEDAWLAVDHPLDRSQVRFDRRIEVVVVCHVEGTSFGCRGPCDQVRAPTEVAAEHGRLAARGRVGRGPDLLDGRGEDPDRVDVGGLGNRIELVDEVGQLLGGHLSVLRGEVELLGKRASVARYLTTVERGGEAHHLATGLSELQTDLSMGARDPDHRKHRLAHGRSALKSRSRMLRVACVTTGS